MNLAAKAIRPEDAFAHWQVQREGDPSKSPLGIVGEPRNPLVFILILMFFLGFGIYCCWRFGTSCNDIIYYILVMIFFKYLPKHTYKIQKITQVEAQCFTRPLQITCVNTMAAGLKYCDRALTVSPSYAVECCTDPEKGAQGGRLEARGF